MRSSRFSSMRRPSAPISPQKGQSQLFLRTITFHAGLPARSSVVTRFRIFLLIGARSRGILAGKGGAAVAGGGGGAVGAGAGRGAELGGGVGEGAEAVLVGGEAGLEVRRRIGEEVDLVDDDERLEGPLGGGAEHAVDEAGPPLE